MAPLHLLRHPWNRCSEKLTIGTSHLILQQYHEVGTDLLLQMKTLSLGKRQPAWHTCCKWKTWDLNSKVTPEASLSTFVLLPQPLP